MDRKKLNNMREGYTFKMVGPYLLQIVSVVNAANAMFGVFCEVPLWPMFLDFPLVELPTSITETEGTLENTTGSISLC